MPISAIKIGYPGSIENIEAIHSILRDYPGTPVIFDPTIRVAQHESEAPEYIYDAMRTLLLPISTIVLCNLSEAYNLAHQADSHDACAQELLESGCQTVLLSGSKTSKDLFESFLYNQQGMVKRFSRERLKIASRGHGTTLSAAITCYIGHGLSITDAIEHGQHFTWQALLNHRRLGMGKHFLNRFFWSDKSSKINTQNKH
jgi:hydroxymethylpyrimidine/phosphomethylpyrimidine kinase